MPWISVIGAVAGAALSSSAAGDAADAQSASAADTNATNRYVFDTQTQLQEPFRQAGVSANDRLMELMGLSPAGMTEAQLRAELTPQFTSRSAPSTNTLTQILNGGIPASAGSVIDEAGLNAEIQRRLAAQQNQPRSADYGSLNQQFDASKMYEDPGYQFRMTEGQKGVENSAAARGGLLSGAALKAIQKYGQNYASGEYGNAYSRHTADQTNTYNRLAGMVNSGQGAANQVSNAAGQYGQNVGNANAALGNAQSAGAIGQANAWTSAIGQGINGYQQNQLMSMIQRPNSGYQDNYLGRTQYTL